MAAISVTKHFRNLSDAVDDGDDPVDDGDIDDDDVDDGDVDGDVDVDGAMVQFWILGCCLQFSGVGKAI